MDIKIGSAPDNWGVWFPTDHKQTPWNRFMDKIIEAEFYWTELGPYGYLPTDIATLKAELEKRNLRVSGTFAMGDLADPAKWPELERQVLGAGESLSALGAPFLVLIDGIYSDERTGDPLTSARVDDDGWKRLVDTTHKVADISRQKFDLRTVFHPHAETHVEYEDQIERMLADPDPARVEFCLYTGHHAYRGGDPVAIMRKHHHRIPYLHIKSVDSDIQRKVEAEKIPFAKAVGHGYVLRTVQRRSRHLGLPRRSAADQLCGLGNRRARYVPRAL